MPKLTVTIAVVLLALAAMALAPDTTLGAYADAVHVLLPKAIAATAALLLVTLFAVRPKATAAVAAAPGLAPAAPLANQADAEVVSFLALLQDKGRLVDFLMDEVSGYNDAQVGAAARVLHAGCKAVLREHFGIRPVRDEDEGSKVAVPAGHAADDYRLVGKISGEAPYTGTLVHHGWKAEWVKLPRLLRTGDGRLPTIAPAEVELL
jgi:hypothetical protein